MAFSCSQCLRYCVLVLVLLGSVHLLYAEQLKGCNDHSVSGNEQIYLNLKCPDLPPRVCKDVKSKAPRTVVTLLNGYEVLCDTETDGGGWIVIQRRLNQDEDFYRTWVDYKYGFGNINGNFWFGNEKIHHLTTVRRYELRVDITFNGTNYFAIYPSFRLLGESENYRIQISGYYGNAGDSLSEFSDANFSTFDRDNDKLPDVSCAESYHGAWWYTSCHKSNLNGLYGSVEYAKGLSWQTTTTYYGSAKTSEMKIRPIY